MKRFLPLLILLSLALSPAQAQPSDWWRDTTWYLLFVRSFYDSDGDGIGDLRGVIEKLDYLESLGIGGLWLMPVNSAQSYHGYDALDYYAIEPDYGTKDDFIALMEAAHARGIRVVVDLVLNHTSSEHPWFLASARGDEATLIGTSGPTRIPTTPALGDKPPGIARETASTTACSGAKCPT